MMGYITNGYLRWETYCVQDLNQVPYVPRIPSIPNHFAPPAPWIPTIPYHFAPPAPKGPMTFIRKLSIRSFTKKQQPVSWGWICRRTSDFAIVLQTDTRRTSIQRLFASPVSGLGPRGLQWFANYCQYKQETQIDPTGNPASFFQELLFKLTTQRIASRQLLFSKCRSTQCKHRVSCRAQRNQDVRCLQSMRFGANVRLCVCVWKLRAASYHVVKN